MQHSDVSPPTAVGAVGAVRALVRAIRAVCGAEPSLRVAVLADPIRDAVVALNRGNATGALNALGALDVPGARRSRDEAHVCAAARVQRVGERRRRRREHFQAHR